MDGHDFLMKKNQIVSLIAVIVPLVAASGCATFKKKAEAPKSDGGAVGQVIRDATVVSSADAAQKPGTAVVSASASSVLEVRGQKLRSNKFDYPVTVNPSVEHWISYFTGKGRKYFDKYLERGRYFIPEISKVLKAHNMPQDLVYLAMIESGFNNSARSRARAVGPWQFMRQTGQRYGLTVDYWLDERRDTRKATLAAIQYLKEMYAEFGSWELASAGYNAGENKVRRAMAKYKTSDFWEIARHRFFKRETRDYVPKIMAAAIITKNPELFGFVDPFKGKRVRNPTIMLADAEKGEEKSDVADDELTPKELGEPVAKDDATEDPADKLALGSSDEKNDGETASDDDEDDLQEAHAIVSNSPSPAMSPSVYMVANPNEQIVEFEIKGPADLFAISKAAGIPFSTVKLLNPELSRWCTPPTMKTYRVKLPKSSKARFLATYNDESFDRRVVFMRYTVRRGDNIQKVARRFAVEAGPIRELNALGTRENGLRVGSSINLPIPTGYKRVIASMYDEKPFTGSTRRRRAHRRKHRVKAESAQHHVRQRLRPNLTASAEN
jgi:hypothetical protein